MIIENIKQKLITVMQINSMNNGDKTFKKSKKYLSKIGFVLKQFHRLI